MTNRRRTSIAIALIFLHPLLAAPQQPIPRPQVEVAAIHPSAPGGGDLGNIHIAPGRFQAHNMTVRKLIAIAYKIKVEQITGGPAWVNSQTYDITATVEDMTGNNFPLTLQTLLEDRFQLKLHPETKESNVYELTPAKGGSKLHPNQPGTCVPFDLSRTRPVQAADAKRCGTWQQTRPGVRDGIGISIANPPGFAFQGLTGQLSYILGKTVLDKTDLTGIFDVHLQWTPDDATVNTSNPADAGLPPSENAPNIFTAVREQLGLELKSTKGPVPILVIDSVDHPSEN